MLTIPELFLNNFHAFFARIVVTLGVVEVLLVVGSCRVGILVGQINGFL